MSGGANVTLDGEFQGQTPITLELTRAKPTGWRCSSRIQTPYRQKQLPAAGRDSQTIKLTAQLGEVKFNISPANAELKIDGKSAAGQPDPVAAGI